VLHAAFIQRRLEQLDPFIYEQYGNRMSSWGESRSLYWLDRLQKPPMAGPRIWMVLGSEVAESRLADGTEVAIVGRMSRGFELPNWFRDTGIDTSPWTLHSDGRSIAGLVAALSGRVRVVLFHNYPRRLRTFVGRNGLDCEVLSGEPVSCVL
jgi:hypothetical protein